MAMHDPIAALGALLDAEAAALRKADVTALAGLADTKATLIDQLKARQMAGDAQENNALATLARKARRNEVILRAAISGLRTARQRLAELSRAAQGTVTYDHTGQTKLHPTGPRRVERRA